MSELLHLLLDWHHWIFEIVSGAIIGASLSPLARRLVRRHDKRYHTPPPTQVNFRVPPTVLSQLTQRIERIEALPTWDDAGEAGM